MPVLRSEDGILSAQVTTPIGAETGIKTIAAMHQPMSALGQKQTRRHVHQEHLSIFINNFICLSFETYRNCFSSAAFCPGIGGAAYTNWSLHGSN
jgi:hypothetical protein